MRISFQGKCNKDQTWFCVQEWKAIKGKWIICSSPLVLCQMLPSSNWFPTSFTWFNSESYPPLTDTSHTSQDTCLVKSTSLRNEKWESWLRENSYKGNCYRGLTKHWCNETIYWKKANLAASKYITHLN